MNSERTSENGRYVWAAILIVLAVVLAAVAFITWVVSADKTTNNVNKANYGAQSMNKGTFDIIEQVANDGNKDSTDGTYNSDVVRNNTRTSMSDKSDVNPLPNTIGNASNNSIYNH